MEDLCASDADWNRSDPNKERVCNTIHLWWNVLCWNLNHFTEPRN